MKRQRISIEWKYASTCALFKYLNMHGKLRIIESDYVSRVHTVVTILHVALCGCQTLNYFSLHVPDDILQRYLTQQDFQ